MKSNYEAHLKQEAIKNIESFKSMDPRKIRVISNSPQYPDSIVVSMDCICDLSAEGYILNNQNKEQYALTPMQIGEAMNIMKDHKECVVPRDAVVYDKKGKRAGSTNLVRFMFKYLQAYKF